MIDQNRVTDKVNVSLIRLELKRSLRPLGIIAIGILVAGFAARYIVSHINGGVGSTHSMRMEVPDATGVVPGRGEVRFYGIEAGKVEKVSLKNGRAVITATVANKFGDIYKNAKVEVRPNTALQDMYVDVVDRGSPRAGKAGSGYTIPLDQAQSPVNLADVLNTFQPGVREHLHTVLDQFGNGLDDRGYALRRSFTLFAPFLRDAGQISDQLARRDKMTKELVHNAGTLSKILASRSTQLRELVTSGTNTLEAASTEGGAPLRQTIAKLPGTLDAATGTFEALDAARPNVTAAVNGLGPVADRLPSGLRDIKSLARSADPAMQRLRTPVRKLQPLAKSLKPFTGQLSTALKRIKPQVGPVNTLTKDFADCIPFMNEFWMWDASMSKYNDFYGPQVRGNVNFGLYTVPGQQQKNYVHDYTCANGKNAFIIGNERTPKYPGPPPSP